MYRNKLIFYFSVLLFWKYFFHLLYNDLKLPLPEICSIAFFHNHWIKGLYPVTHKECRGLAFSSQLLHMVSGSCSPALLCLYFFPPSQIFFSIKYVGFFFFQIFCDGAMNKQRCFLDQNCRKVSNSAFACQYLKEPCWLETSLKVMQGRYAYPVSPLKT